MILNNEPIEYCIQETSSEESKLVDKLIATLPVGGDVQTEYPVFRKYSQLGVGDLCVEYKDCIWVIEVKHINLIDSGKTARVKRTRNRRKVREQAVNYASWVRLRAPETKTVHAKACTRTKTI